MSDMETSDVAEVALAAVPVDDHDPESAVATRTAGTTTTSVPTTAQPTAFDTNRSPRGRITEHRLPMDELCSRYDVHIDVQKPSASLGLTTATVTERIAMYGANVMTPPKQVSLVVKFLKCMGNLFNLLLVIAGLVSFIVYAIEPEGNQLNVGQLWCWCVATRESLC